jgi:hypothetical protein
VGRGKKSSLPFGERVRVRGKQNLLVKGALTLDRLVERGEDTPL